MKKTTLRILLIFSVLISASVYIGSCGGGGGGGGGTGTTGAINLNNASDVTYAAIYTMKEPLNVGTYVTQLLIASLKNVPMTNICLSGSFAFDPAVTGQLTGTYALTFTNCVNAQHPSMSTPEIINGTATVTINGVTGDPTAQDYTVKTMITDINISIVESGTDYTSLITGNMIFKETSTGGNILLQAMSIDNPNTTLTYVETSHGQTRKEIIGQFSVAETISTLGAYEFGMPGDMAAVTASFPGNTGTSVTVTAVTQLNGTGPDAIPGGGSFTVMATDGSSLTATISNAVVDLAVDSNGDGNVEGHVTEPWEYFD